MNSEIKSSIHILSYDVSNKSYPPSKKHPVITERNIPEKIKYGSQERIDMNMTPLDS